ncbi:Holliday junction resolvase RuvX [Allofrancisella guangzhouensis]|uniref:Putative pre-16S rRNA nuclease n=1 Tax=Allofrancisella guangzhouensis TaxID=594679 RepID=A0A0A8E545_9GAMM|nr:Holliday junction resolvase RuvX [Allofrancisella guangzhouensis]AJC49093.1 Holliday junction resolvase [Allofrancisella guangzhouensis]MBK2027856.1 Holliday junction resolvase RuvX [Allofrancisella guangzhouensis]MBK2044843.1 Holliday junction resolvase RuvX [Allofrancisella guangzhouensis]MBK2046303.1 Holliday junction resolvase RuvX [Allofrancisella guangzhouensis]
MIGTLLAIDYGRARIGLASGQMITKTASPIGTVEAYDGKPNWLELDRIIKRWNPSDIIIGLPLDTNDLDTDITRDARNFAKEIQDRYQKNIHLINEAYSTREARWRLENVKNKKVSHIKVDALAACVILETWMSEN